jgi:hypothetical protein
MDNEQRTAIVRSIAVLVVGIIIIGVIVWMVFFRGDDQKKDVNKSPTASQQAEKNSSSSGVNAGQQQGAQKQPGQAASGSGASSSQNPSRPQQLANVGPGDMTGLFVFSAVAGAAVHSVYRRKRRTAL